MQDYEIVDLYWNRSEIAIKETDLKYGRYCKRIAINILSNNQDAEECVNDAYLGAWNAIPPQRPFSLLSFLGRIIRNIALDRYDYNNAKKRNNKFDVLLSELDECLSQSSDNVENKYEEGEVAKLISDFLLSINSVSRNVFLHRYWYTDSISDIANNYGMSESKVKSILFRVRKKLKKYLEKEGIQI